MRITLENSMVRFTDQVPAPSVWASAAAPSLRFCRVSHWHLSQEEMTQCYEALRCACWAPQCGGEALPLPAAPASCVGICSRVVSVGVPGVPRTWVRGSSQGILARGSRWCPPRFVLIFPF